MTKKRDVVLVNEPGGESRTGSGKDRKRGGGRGGGFCGDAVTLSLRSNLRSQLRCEVCTLALAETGRETERDGEEKKHRQLREKRGIMAPIGLKAVVGESKNAALSFTYRVWPQSWCPSCLSM